MLDRAEGDLRALRLPHADEAAIQDFFLAQVVDLGSALRTTVSRAR